MVNSGSGEQLEALTLRRQPHPLRRRVRIFLLLLPPQPPGHRICDKCHGRADLLESLSVMARVDYYRCGQGFHVWMQDIDPNAPRIDVMIKVENKQAS